jgi:hypothetical protein
VARKRTSSANPRGRLGRPDPHLWREAAQALFGNVSCDSLKRARRLQILLIDAQMRAASAPRRRAWCDKLTRIAELASKLAALLSSHSVKEHAPDLSDVLSDTGADSAMVLGRVVRLSQRHLDGLPAGGGRGGADMALGFPSPQMQCAAAVAKVWERRGRKQSNRDDKTVACAALWLFAGGPVTQEVDGGEDPAEMWRRHLRPFAQKRKGSLRPEPVLKRRRRGEPAKVKSGATEAAKLEFARDRARRALDGPWVRNWRKI